MSRLKSLNQLGKGNCNYPEKEDLANTPYYKANAVMSKYCEITGSKCGTCPIFHSRKALEELIDVDESNSS